MPMSTVVITNPAPDLEPPQNVTAGQSEQEQERLFKDKDALCGWGCIRILGSTFGAMRNKCRPLVFASEFRKEI